MSKHQNKQGFVRWSLRMLMLALLGLLVLTLAFEWYNPLGLLNSPGKPNQLKTFRMTVSGGEVKKQIQRFNNIGCLGENYADSITRPKVFFIGSSTTLNSLVPWASQWPVQLMRHCPYWFNNAGVDGSGVLFWKHMLASMAQYSPNYIVVLYSPRKSKVLDASESRSWWIWNRLKTLAFVRSVLIPYTYALRANKKQEGYTTIHWRSLPYAKGQAPLLDSVYLQQSIVEAGELIDAIRGIGAVPILIAQPTPFGNYEEAGIRVGDLALAKKEMMWHTAMAEALKVLCEKRETPFINGEQFPKSFRYYLDLSHFNEAGNIAFANFIRDSLQAILAKDELR